MLIDTPTVVTHLLDNPDTYLFPIGGFLRRSSLNELSQLFSVLKGDMSLVDPRLLLVEYLPLYSEKQARRHEIKPGITGGAD
jgi:O-antigen biosynthesis protein WbqP